MNAESLQTSAVGSTISVNGIEMYYEHHGEGPPLLLLHWYTGSGGVWQPFVEAFARHYRLIIPDLRGHGRSTNPCKQFTHRQVALDIFALLDHLEIDQCKAIGASSGGEVLLHMATQQPARVEAMVLVGTELYYTQQTRAHYREHGANREGWNWEKLRQRHVLGDEQIRTLIDMFYSFADDYEDMNFTPPLLSTIQARTLIVQGDRDLFCPISFAVEMYTSIPDASLWIVPNGDHLPILGKHAALFTQTVMEFLQGEQNKVG